MSEPNEHTSLLIPHDEEGQSVRSREEVELGHTSIGERLSYNDYSTIDWLHCLVKDSYRFRALHLRHGTRASINQHVDACSGWIAVSLIGIIMAFVAVSIDMSVATVAGLKYGYCAGNPLVSREACCEYVHKEGINCDRFTLWSDRYWPQFGIYVGWAVLFGIISSGVTMFSKTVLPAVGPEAKNPNGYSHSNSNSNYNRYGQGKSLYMSAGSGIPEIKTILSGFVIPHYLDFRILVLKAIGAVFAVATGMSLGKEGPFIHIAACVGQQVANRFEKYRENAGKWREILSAACAAGLSSAFGAPIGGVLFAYEEICVHFPRKVLWRTFLCSMVAAITLKALNPHGTGKVILFETNYGTSYRPEHYFTFIILGISGGLWGGTFTMANLLWARWFRNIRLIKGRPVLEVFFVIMVTAALQFPNPVTRAPGVEIIKNLLVNCATKKDTWVCRNEARTDGRWDYIAWLAYGTLGQLASTTITFGLKVPAGIIIPALVGGALFGRLVGQWVTTISPGIFAMVGAGAFLAGVGRMTISLCVIMFELTGELEYSLPHMIAILVAKWTADAISKESVYDLAQSVLGHPFLDTEHALRLIQHEPSATVQAILPPASTMAELTIEVPSNNKVPQKVLKEHLNYLHRRGLMDGGIVLTQKGVLQGYIAEPELEYGLNEFGKAFGEDKEVRLFGDVDEGEYDLSNFVDRTPITITNTAPMEYAVEIFGKLGIRYLCVTEEGSGRLVGFVIKKRLLIYLDGLKD
ncbi:chloride channel-like protein 3 [Lindgomyces ingoldianus]|uniref:Chloride channel-like protein 3 n=1 Tax=Lindgomyces ingoldianus TaxID=673940 RepID=A0ACB6QFI2_9PLEO|nr:chloride channel-like protein 3 [Lindgomyces ingoldianus]KAF2465250.1 chloride channel-like protein 3 [Lindgomyces ingoldianus]